MPPVKIKLIIHSRTRAHRAREALEKFYKTLLCRALWAPKRGPEKVEPILKNKLKIRSKSENIGDFTN